MVSVVVPAEISDSTAIGGSDDGSGLGFVTDDRFGCLLDLPFSRAKIMSAMPLMIRNEIMRNRLRINTLTLFKYAEI